MKGRETKGAPSADLLVCFPTRAHLTLMPPKPICSPARLLEPTKSHNRSRHARKKSMSRLGSSGGGKTSPLFWAKNKQIGTDISEPTSPKVTCSGQIKVRHKATTANCKSWQSVMEEIERIHNDRKNKKRSTWVESMGFKKDILHFLTCLRNIRLDFRCFGAFHRSDITSDGEDEEEEDEEEDEEDYKEAIGGGGGSECSRTVFSKWFMVLQENQIKGCCKEERKEVNEKSLGDEETLDAPCAPPPNALLLMRCRSAPAKSWIEEKQEEEEEKLKGEYQEDVNKDEEKVERKQDVVKKGKNLKTLMEEEERNEKKESLLVMRYDSGLYKISSDIAKETWVVGGMIDPLSRSRSWKR